MGIDIICCDKSFCASYSTWNDIRIIIIINTFDYIENELNMKIEENKDYIESEDYYKIIILELKNLFNKKKTIQNFINLCNNYEYMNSLNYYDLGGLYSLCNQSDCEGFYTPGNSLDICILLDKIKLHIKKEDIYERIYIDNNDIKESLNDKLYDIFEYSYKLNKKVIIC